MSDQDGTYEACLTYLTAKGHVLWGDYSLNPNENDDGTPKNRPAALWLEAQVRGVASHYDTSDNPAPPYVGTHEEHVAAQQAFYRGPYSSERNGGGQRPLSDQSAPRLCAGPFGDDEALPTAEELNAVPPSQRNTVRHRPSALVTHGQQPEQW